MAKAIKLLTLITLLALAGCATPPAFLANHFDRGDVCQDREFSDLNGARLKPQGYKIPSFCGGGTKTYVIKDAVTGRQLYTVRTQ